MITKEYLQQELAKRIDGYKRGVATTTDNIIAEMKSILVLVDALNDYEKKYNEALERAKAYHRNELAGTRQEMTEYIFPELRESEEETTRKELLDFVKSFWADHKEALPQTSRWVTYLEKQKEQKPNYCHHEVDETGWTEEYRKAYYDGWNNCNMQHEQLKADHNPAEWSEEDEGLISLTIAAVEDFYDKNNPIRSKIINRLKSLRPQPHWKPSEEQIDAVRYFVSKHQSEAWAATGQWKQFTALRGLLGNLMKLM